METLVDMAKRLGIRPNPRMTDKERKKVYALLAEYMKRKVPPKYHRRIRGERFWEIEESYYALCKKVDRKITNLSQLRKNYSFFTRPISKIKQYTQQDAFLWHNAGKGLPIRERFVVDFQLDSPYFPEVIKKLDAFILKYHAAFKITNEKHKDRTDSLNLYFPYDITPKIAKEFVQIIRPCLSEQYDNFLNGVPLTENGKIIKGLRTGPEYSDKISQHKNYDRLEKETGMNCLDTSKLASDTSLGEKVANIEALNLAYYLVGKEGQNPYHLLSYDGKPYRKSLEINEGERSLGREVVSFTKVPPVKKVPEILKQKSSSVGNAFHSLLKTLSQEITGLRQEVKYCHKDISSLRAYQAETRKHLRLD